MKSVVVFVRGDDVRRGGGGEDEAPDGDDVIHGDAEL
jgi:hypothetical protein